MLKGFVKINYLGRKIIVAVVEKWEFVSVCVRQETTTKLLFKLCSNKFNLSLFLQSTLFVRVGNFFSNILYIIRPNIIIWDRINIAFDWSHFDLYLEIIFTVFHIALIESVWISSITYKAPNTWYNFFLHFSAH